MFERLGNYTIDKKLADGGMGSVYLGRSQHGIPVVLKVPHAQDRESGLALADEARAGIRLKHPAVVETLDFFVDNGIAVLVVAYIDGVSLFELRRPGGPLPPAAVAQIGAELAGALASIHSAVDERGRPLAMVHRDVSPNNVLIDVEGSARLIDLGIVRSSERRQKATMQGMVKGTLRYLAPEILLGSDHTPASDVWALGVTLFEAAVGRYAVGGDEMLTVRASMDGSLAELVRTSASTLKLDPVLVDALAALVAPVEARVQNARAAAAILARVAAKLGGGTALLATAVRTKKGISTAPVATDRTEVTGRVALAPLDAPDVLVTSAPLAAPADPDASWESGFTSEATAQTMLSSRGDVESVFTTTAPRDVFLPPRPATNIQAPPKELPIDAAPTLQMPAMNLPMSAQPTSSQPAAARVLSDDGAAPTIQMGAWQPPDESESAPQTLLQIPASQIPSAPVSAVGPTLLQMPVAQVPRGPAPSLFLPIVVVDEDGEEIG